MAASYGVLIGSNAITQFAPGVTDISIASAQFASGIAVGANAFTVATTGNYVIEVSLFVSGLVGAQRYTLQLFNSTTGQVVDSITLTTQGRGGASEGTPIPFYFTVTNAAHQYKLRISLPTDGTVSGPAIVLYQPNFRAVVASAASASGGGGAPSPVNTNSLTSPYTLLQTDSNNLFYTGAGGAFTFNIPSGLAAPWHAYFWHSTAAITVTPQAGVLGWDGSNDFGPGAASGASQGVSQNKGAWGLLMLVTPTTFAWQTMGGNWNF